MNGLELENCTFERNRALSAFTMTAQGGAIMASYSSVLGISKSVFRENVAEPRDQDTLTNSGEGGAIYSQSSSLHIIGPGTLFSNNVARSGQFDQGSAGGAILMEDSYNSSIYECEFRLNGAAGLNRISAYSAAGAGGAIYLKFSFTQISVSNTCI